jgi:hypothetical protein
VLIFQFTFAFVFLVGTLCGAVTFEQEIKSNRHAIRCLDALQEIGRNVPHVQINHPRPYWRYVREVSKVDWVHFVGRTVLVSFPRFLKVSNGTRWQKSNIAIRQDVMRKEELPAKIAEQIQPLIERSQMKVLGFIPKSIEAGVIIVETADGFFSSPIFTSKSSRKIEHEDIWPELIILLKSLAPTGVIDLKHLYLVHTHPGKGAPLSPTDIISLVNLTTAVSYNMTDPHSPPIKISILAVPTLDNGRVIFSKTRETEKL